jgi:hypothetical protein
MSLALRFMGLSLLLIVLIELLVILDVQPRAVERASVRWRRVRRM